MPTPPALERIVETALYVDDIERARSFYRDALGLNLLLDSHALCAFDVGGKSVLLLFKRHAMLTTQVLPGGPGAAHGEIPPHDGAGPVHMGFAIAEDQLAPWEARLSACNIPIEGRVRWPRGGESIYFRDPDRHLLELMTPGVWATY